MIPDDNKPIAERVTLLEYQMKDLCEDVRLVMTNHLPHISEKMDALSEQITEIKIQTKENAVRIGIIVSIFIATLDIALKVLI